MAENHLGTKSVQDCWTSSCNDNRTRHVNNGDQLGMIRQSLKQKEFGSQNYHENSIAVIGVSCRLPKSNTTDEFWELLIKKNDGISLYPKDRVESLKLEENLCNYNCGSLNCPIEDFDANFFGISPRDAEQIDPQQRLLLEVAWEALENAAINPHSLNGGNTAIFTGVWRADYEKTVKESMEHMAIPKVVLGNSFSATSARLSYVLGCNGQNIAIESGCSSSMVALHLACGSLARKETDLAIVMGANLLISMDLFEDDVVLSKDGHCKTFDEKADGYGRSEGIAAIVLKRLTDGIESGDRIMAVIRGSGISQEGTTSSFGTPSARCQEIAIRMALENAHISPKDVDYVEAHGTGTVIGDYVEISALSSCYSGERDKPLVVSSVKTNIGHGEAVSGLAGLIKVILSLEKEIIPPHRNFETLHPSLNLEKIPAIVPLACLDWKRSTNRVRIAGISSFGISGTNIHVIVEESPYTKLKSSTINNIEECRTYHLLTLSAKTNIALYDLTHRYINFLNANMDIDIRDLTFTANIGRAHFENRLSVIGRDTKELIKELKKDRLPLTLTESPKIAFIFTGHGCQYAGMGNVLYKSNFVYKNAFDRCADIVTKETGIDLKKEIFDVDGDVQLGQKMSHQLSIFSIEYALVSLLLRLEIKPYAVIGHNVGEYTAAVTAGIIDLEEALRLLVKISKISGETTEMLNSLDKASHKIECKPSDCKYISGTTGLETGYEIVKDKKYWLRVLREPGNIDQGIRTLSTSGYNTFIEIGPNTLLLPLAKQILDGNNFLLLPTFQQNEDDWKVLLNNLGRLYLNKVNINWNIIETTANRKKLVLPTYAFQRERCWLGALEKNQETIHPILGRKVAHALKRETVYANRLSLKDLRYLKDYQVADRVIVPVGVFLEVILAAAKDILLKPARNIKYALNIKQFVVHASFEMKETELYETEVVVVDVENEINNIQIDMYVKYYKGWQKQVSALVSLVEEDAIDSSHYETKFEELKSLCNERNLYTDVSNKFKKTGINIGEVFRCLTSVWHENEESCATISSKLLTRITDKHFYHPMVLDSMFQVMLTLLMKDLYLNLPGGIENCVIYQRKVSDIVFVHAKVDKNTKSGTIELYDEQNVLLIAMKGVRFITTTINSFQCSIERQKYNLPGLYQEIWVNKEGPFDSRVNLKIIPALNSFIFPNKRKESSMVNFDPNIYETLKIYVHFSLKKIFLQNNVGFKLGKQYTSIDVIKHNLILLKYANFFKRLLQAFVEDGIIYYLGNKDTWEVVKEFPTLTEIEEKISNLEQTLKKTDQIDIEVWRKCLAQLWKIITGEIDPVTALFNRADLNILDIYQSSFIRQPNVKMGIIVSQVLAPKLVEGGGEGSIARIIEIGGGSASTTIEILKQLKKSGIRYKYTFTDVSPNFFENAQNLLSGFEDVEYKMLDIEKEPKNQGFQPNYYDIVIASNVIHATEDLRKSIENVRQLLTHGGLLLLQEILKPYIFVDVIVGPLDGFWLFKDYDLRPCYPCANKEIWDRVLMENHFESSHLFTESDAISSIIVSRAVPIKYLTSGKVNDQCISKLSAENTWLILSDSVSRHISLVNKMTNFKEKAIILNHGNYDKFENVGAIDMMDSHKLETSLDSVIASNNVCGVFYLISNLPDFNENTNYIKTLNFCKYFARKSLKNVKFLVATRGAIYTGNEKIVHPPSSGIWGMIKSLMVEVQNSIIRLVDLDPDELDCDLDAEEILHETFSDNKDYLVCYRKQRKFASRFVEINEKMTKIFLPKGRYDIQVPRSNIINDLTFLPAKIGKLGANDVEIVVKAISLNFRDALLVLKPDKFHIKYHYFGSDYAGVVSSVGDKVTKFKVGEEVFGLKWGTAASHIIQKETDLIFHKPYDMNYYEASTFPSCYLTVYYSLIVVAKLKQSDTVLIHAAAGGVGLFAIQVAKYIGAQIIVTAGSNRKKSYLKSLGIKHIFHSRVLSFGMDIKNVTNGRGVDVVLNSLTGTGFKETTLDICAKNARFVEIGKINIWTRDDVIKLRPDMMYAIVDLEKLSPAELADGMLLVTKKKIIKPICYSKFHLTKIREAVNFLAKASHIGKLVLFMPEVNDTVAKEVAFSKLGTYIITGGLGGLGLEVAKWMSSSFGADCLVLIGRSIPNEKAQQEITKMRTLGINILSFQVDVGNMSQCKNLLEKVNAQLPPLKGIIHSAGALSDATFSNQSWEKYQIVFNAKVQGCLNLHNLTKELELEHFVLFSSMVANINQIGQSNHSAANCFLDAFAYYRHSMGLPCQTINWGVWSDIGAAVNSNFFKNSESGIQPFTPAQGLSALEFIMGRPDLSQIAVANLSINDFIRFTSPLGNYFSDLQFETINKSSGQGNQDDSSKCLDNLYSLSYDGKISFIKNILSHLVIKELKLAEWKEVNENQNFSEMGFDSLMMIDLKNKIITTVGDKIAMNNLTLLNYPTINTLSKYVVESFESFSVDEEHVNANTDNVLESKELKSLVEMDSILPEVVQGDKTFVAADKIRNVFLTGGTGQMGPYFINGLLKIPEVKIVCLVRGSSSDNAYQRLVDSIKKYQLLVDMKRITVVKGSISKEMFGLDVKEYTQLSATIDCVCHLAAKVNFFEKYDQGSPDLTDMRSVNVIGTVNVIKFAANIRTKRVLYASTMMAINRLTTDGFACEELPDADNNGEVLTMGYVLTKFVGEKLMKQAISRGIPCIVIRYPAIIGHSETGYFNVKDSSLATNIILVCLKLGMVFNAAGGIPAFPADSTADVTVELLSKETSYSNLFNLWLPTVIKFSELNEIAAEIGYCITTVTQDEFVSKLKEESQSSDLLKSFISKFGIDFLNAMQQNSFMFKRLLHGKDDEVVYKLSEKINKILPNITERIHPKETLKRSLTYAKSEGVLKSLGIFPG